MLERNKPWTLKFVPFNQTILKLRHKNYFDSKPINCDLEHIKICFIFASNFFLYLGMNEKEFGTAWGGEDWELLDRLIRNGYYLFHAMLPRFYHVFHSNKDTWDGTKN